MLQFSGDFGECFVTLLYKPITKNQSRYFPGLQMSQRPVKIIALVTLFCAAHSSVEFSKSCFTTTLDKVVKMWKMNVEFNS